MLLFLCTECSRLHSHPPLKNVLSSTPILLELILKTQNEGEAFWKPSLSPDRGGAPWEPLASVTGLHFEVCTVSPPLDLSPVRGMGACLSVSSLVEFLALSRCYYRISKKPHPSGVSLNRSELALSSLPLEI